MILSLVITTNFSFSVNKFCSTTLEEKDKVPSPEFYEDFVNVGALLLLVL